MSVIRNPKNRLAALLLLLVMGWTAFAGQVIYVDGDATGADGTSWLNAYRYLQDALADADSSAKPVQIRVAQGIYKPDQGRGNRIATFQLINGVTIRGGYAGFGQPEPDARDIERYETILSGDLNSDDGPDFAYNAENSLHILIGSGTGESAVLDGFTITGGNANGPRLASYPYYDESLMYGGGMFNTEGSPTLIKCTFSTNSANFGGGMYNGSSSHPTLTNCTFSNNNALWADQGGARGGGMYNDEASSPTLANCTFSGNSTTATYWSCGGGIYNHKNSSPALTNCTFSGNCASGQQGRGGGMCNDINCSPTLVNCIFSGNWAGRFGGAMYNHYESNTRLTNCTFSHNSADKDGGGMYSDYASKPILTNCIVWANTTTQISSGQAIVSHSNVQGGWPGEANIDADPLFADVDGPDNVVGTEDDNLRLLAGSPCIDAGDNSTVPAAVTTDPDANPRIEKDIVDMGAYEGANQGFIFSPKSVTVPEGDLATFTVALATDPLGAVDVSSAFEGGDQDITVESGGLLVFDSSNYWIGQPITLAAAEDADYYPGKASIWVSAPGFPTIEIKATELDDEAPAVLYVEDDAEGADNGTSWSNAFTSLQDVLRVPSMVPEVVEIRVAQGTYKPDQGTGITPGDRTATFQLINGLAIKGGYAGLGGPDPNARNIVKYRTILSGDLSGDDTESVDPEDLLDEPSRAENSLHVVTASGTDETAILDGFTITGGNADPKPAGGVTILYRPSPPPDSASAGGGMTNREGNPTVINCTFSGNSAEKAGGGMCNSYYSSPTLTNCVFSGNSAGSRGGGGLYNTYGSRVTLRNCRISQNVAESSGGGLSFTDTGATTITDCSISENSTNRYGGGIYYLHDSLTITNCSFSRNSASSGGAIHCASSSLTATNCTFTGNWVSSYGGGINFEGTSFWMDRRLSFTNCTFAGNSADSGNALRCYSESQSVPSTVEATNCILWDGGDEIWNNDNLLVTVAHSNVQGGWPGEGNIDADPYFATPGYWDANGTPEDANDDVWIDGDYHLKSQAGRWDPPTADWIQDDITSPCIDAADMSSPIGYEPFPNGGVINMGAYGGTTEASKSYFGQPVCETVIAGDINGDCRVDFFDFELIAFHWLEKR